MQFIAYVLILLDSIERNNEIIVYICLKHKLYYEVLRYQNVAIYFYIAEDVLFENSARLTFR